MDNYLKENYKNKELKNFKKFTIFKLILKLKLNKIKTLLKNKNKIKEKNSRKKIKNWKKKIYKRMINIITKKQIKILKAYLKQKKACLTI